jgi:hypothetical protein
LDGLSDEESNHQHIAPDHVGLALSGLVAELNPLLPQDVGVNDGTDKEHGKENDKEEWKAEHRWARFSVEGGGLSLRRAVVPVRQLKDEDDDEEGEEDVVHLHVSILVLE